MGDALRFHPSVVDDLGVAIDHYDGISQRLGDRFRETVNAGFDAITAQPEIYPVAFNDVRFMRLTKFPYLILFQRIKQVVKILGIFHGASDPQKWRERVR